MDTQPTARCCQFYHNHRRLPGPVVLYVNDNNEQLTEQQAFGQARWTWQNKAWSAFAAAKYDWQKSHYTHHNTAIAVGAPRQKYYQREVYLTAGMQRNFSHHIALAYATDYAHTALSSNLPATKRVSRDTWLQSLSASWHAGPVSLTLRGLCHLYANHRPGAEAADNEVRLTPAVSASVRAVGQRHLRVFCVLATKRRSECPRYRKLLSSFGQYRPETRVDAPNQPGADCANRLRTMANAAHSRCLLQSSGAAHCEHTL